MSDDMTLLPGKALIYKAKWLLEDVVSMQRLRLESALSVCICTVKDRNKVQSTKYLLEDAWWAFKD